MGDRRVSGATDEQSVDPWRMLSAQGGIKPVQSGAGTGKYMSTATPPDNGSPVAIPPRGRSWVKKFDDAFRGLKLGVRGHSSFFVHFFVATVVIAAAATLRVGLVQWCILLGCVAAVIAAELFNSTIEILCRVLEVEKLPHGKAPLDIAAGAVLAVAIGASIIGVIIFSARLIELFA